MSKLDDLLSFNKSFVENKEYEPYQTSKLPNKKMVILTCMDTRLVELLPKAMNLRNGDAKIIKNAGAVVTHPFGSIMRSIIVAVYELGADEIFVIGHHGCGMGSLDSKETMKKMRDHGISEDTLQTLEYSGVNLNKWLERIESIPDSVRASVEMIQHHPLVPKNVQIHGLVIDPETGLLDHVVSK